MDGCIRFLDITCDSSDDHQPACEIQITIDLLGAEYQYVRLRSVKETYCFEISARSTAAGNNACVNRRGREPVWESLRKGLKMWCDTGLVPKTHCHWILSTKQTLDPR
jgi:hypothetical protein